jgi:predicted pyridoxine 5'-phosphate oxidase superfamily flavin-nucleotide-binding protein
MTTPDPFHEGERFVQERAGERDIAVRVGALLADAVPSRAVPFLAEQRMLAIGSVDGEGRMWASVLFGARGLVSTVDGRSVIIDRTRIDANAIDPVWGNLRVAAEVGLLAIELASRRRLRINGVVSAIDERRIEVRVREAYPNCPKYIQRRHVRETPAAPSRDAQWHSSGVSLDHVRSLAVERADTLFVASRHPTRSVDVSHRGGEPGFVRVLDADRLRIPDYRGNSMFNTLGNFAVHDRAGLVFPDFGRGTLLQLTGTVVLRFGEKEDPRQPTGGTGRYWDFQITHWLELPVMTPVAWENPEFSPHNPKAPAHPG